MNTLLVLLACAAALVAAECPVQNTALHASFSDRKNHNKFICGSGATVTGTCDPGYVVGSGGAPEARCCGDEWVADYNKNPCVPATTTKPTPTPTSTSSTKPTPSSSTKPAPTSSGKPTPTSTSASSTKPAPTSSTTPAPTSSGKPAPTSSTTPVPTSSGKPKPTPTPAPLPNKLGMYALYAGTKAYCAVLNFDSMTFNNGANLTLTVDSSSQVDDPTDAVCPNFDGAVPKVSATPTLAQTFKVTKNDVTYLVDVDVTFTVNGTYTTQSVSSFDKSSGNGAVTIELLQVAITNMTAGAQAPLSVTSFGSGAFKGAFAAAANKSYQCVGTSEFVAPLANTTFAPAVKNAKNATVSFENLASEALTPTTMETFAPAAANAVCSATKKKSNASKTGLVIGGIIGGLAVIGILMFVYTRCKSERDGYQSLDPV